MQVGVPRECTCPCVCAPLLICTHICVSMCLHIANRECARQGAAAHCVHLRLVEDDRWRLRMSHEEVENEADSGPLEWQLRGWPLALISSFLFTTAHTAHTCFVVAIAFPLKASSVSVLQCVCTSVYIFLLHC